MLLQVMVLPLFLPLQVSLCASMPSDATSSRMCLATQLTRCLLIPTANHDPVRIMIRGVALLSRIDLSPLLPLYTHVRPFWILELFDIVPSCWSWPSPSLMSVASDLLALFDIVLFFVLKMRESRILCACHWSHRHRHSWSSTNRRERNITLSAWFPFRSLINWKVVRSLVQPQVCWSNATLSHSTCLVMACCSSACFSSAYKGLLSARARA
jgi:hypothetical protein